MFDDLLLHPKTKLAAATYLKTPSHALLISGVSGSGKLTLARSLAASLLQTEPEKLDNYAHFIHIKRPDKKQDIPIEVIRSLNKALSLRIPGKSAIDRVAIIEDAHFMNGESQNSFLKSLEEPPAGTVFILTTNSISSLLPTLTSRTAKLKLTPVDLSTAASYLSNKDKAEVQAAWRLSGGAPALLVSLLKDETNELKQSVLKAKQLLGYSGYERLIEFDKLSRNKQELLELLNGLSQVIKALYKVAAVKNNGTQVARLTSAFRTITEAQMDLQLNVNPRLVGLKLSLNFSI